jgi:protein-arginine kinase activator protein McsA
VDLTFNIYAKKRDERLAELAEKVGENVFSEPKCAKSVHRKYVPSTKMQAKLLQKSNLGETVVKEASSAREYEKAAMLRDRVGLIERLDR